MKHVVMVVYDSAAAIYAGPFLFKTDHEGRRWFADLVDSKDNMVGKHPEDHTLMRCGHFDDSKCEFETQEPIKVVNGVEVVSLLLAKSSEDN